LASESVKQFQFYIIEIALIFDQLPPDAHSRAEIRFSELKMNKSLKFQGYTLEYSAYQLYYSFKIAAFTSSRLQMWVAFCRQPIDYYAEFSNRVKLLQPTAAAVSKATARSGGRRVCNKFEVGEQNEGQGSQAHMRHDQVIARQIAARDINNSSSLLVLAL